MRTNKQMFVTYLSRYGDDDSSDVVQLDPSTSNSPTPGTSGSGVKKQLPINPSFKRQVTYIKT